MTSRLMQVVCGNCGSFVPLFSTEVLGDEVLGLATRALCIVLPLFFDDTVGFFLPKTLDHFFVGHFFAHFLKCVPFMCRHVCHKWLRFFMFRIHV